MLVTILIIAFLLLDILFLAQDKYIFSAFWFIAGAVLGYFFLPGVAEFIQTTDWLIAIPTYLAIGAIFTTGKWFLYIIKKGKHFKEKMERARVSHPEWTLNNIYYYIIHGMFSDTSRGVMSEEEFLVRITPKAGDNIDRITFWLLQWPFVIVATLIEDVVIKLGQHLAEFIDYLFSDLAKKVMWNTIK